MTPQELLIRCRRAGVSNVLCFLGEEKFWFNECLLEIEKILFPEGGQDFGKVVFAAQGLEPAVILGELATPPFFGGARLLVIRGLEKATAAVDEALYKGLDRLAAGTYLVLEGDKLDGRRHLAKALEARQAVVDCAPMKPKQAQEWVVEEGRRQGVAILPQIARTLIERKGTSPGILREEVAKAAVYQGQGGHITAEEWDALIGGATETNIFGMLDGVARGETGRALTLLEQLIRMGEAEMRILYMIGNHLHQLVSALTLRQAGGDVRRLQQELVLHPYTAQKIWEQAKAFDLSYLAKAIERVLRAEYKIKTGQGDPRWELEMAVIDLTTGL